MAASATMVNFAILCFFLKLKIEGIKVSPSKVLPSYISYDTGKSFLCYHETNDNDRLTNFYLLTKATFPKSFFNHVSLLVKTIRVLSKAFVIKRCHIIKDHGKIKGEALLGNLDNRFLHVLFYGRDNRECFI